MNEMNVAAAERAMGQSVACERTARKNALEASAALFVYEMGQMLKTSGRLSTDARGLYIELRDHDVTVRFSWHYRDDEVITVAVEPDSGRGGIERMYEAVDSVARRNVAQQVAAYAVKVLVRAAAERARKDLIAKVAREAERRFAAPFEAAGIAVDMSNAFAQVDIGENRKASIDDAATIGTDGLRYNLNLHHLTQSEVIAVLKLLRAPKRNS